MRKDQYEFFDSCMPIPDAFSENSMLAFLVFSNSAAPNCWKNTTSNFQTAPTHERHGERQVVFCGPCRSIKNGCGSLTIDVQRMPLNGVKMETPFQKWFKPPPSGKHSSPEIHFQGNLSMGPCFIAMTTKRHVDTCGDISKPCQLPSPMYILLYLTIETCQKTHGHWKR